jgi:DNA-binding Xre family transcriptional regulator
MDKGEKQMVRLRIQELATEQGLNQFQLVLKAQVTPSLLNRYWNGKTDKVTLSELAKIARALGVRTGDLIADEDQQKEEATAGS